MLSFTQRNNAGIGNANNGPRGADLAFILVLLRLVPVVVIVVLAGIVNFAFVFEGFSGLGRAAAIRCAACEDLCRLLAADFCWFLIKRRR